VTAIGILAEMLWIIPIVSLAIGALFVHSINRSLTKKLRRR
jgi:cytochrome c-type biogenesis protein CcmH/NrfF